MMKQVFAGKNIIRFSSTPYRKLRIDILLPIIKRILLERSTYELKHFKLSAKEKELLLKKIDKDIDKYESDLKKIFLDLLNEKYIKSFGDDYYIEDKDNILNKINGAFEETLFLTSNIAEASLFRYCNRLKKGLPL